MREVELGSTGRRISRIGLGGMPLSLSGRPGRERAKAVIRRAVELDITFIDTADTYCIDDGDLHHNERLIREALEEAGAGDRVLVATKGGLTRPEGRWERDARPEHLREACHGSLEALGTDRIDLYQLHAPDPDVPWEESVSALAQLRDEGSIAHVGLSNVDDGQLWSAEEIVPITSVQNRYNPWDRSSEESGLIRYCLEHDITFIPYSPLGGARRVKLVREDENIRRIGEREGVSPEEAVLAWVLGRSPSLVPIPGASRRESIESSAGTVNIELGEESLRELERAFESLPD